MNPSRTSRREFWLALSAVSAVNAAVLWYFHNRYWYPTDDGFYAHIAERLLSGEVLNRDVQDIHPGYVHAVHVLALQFFGIDLVSLRYPMIAAAFVQSVVIAFLLRSRGLLTAIAGSFASIALGVIQFMSPNPNWYCLALAFVLAWWLMKMPHGPARLVGAGLILGTLTLFRHLTGIWVAMAVIALVLIERDSDARGRQLTLMRVQIAIMLVGLVGYLYWSPDTELGGWIFMGLWPIAVLGWMLVNLRTHNRDVAVSVGQLLAGSLLSAAPLITYYVAHRSIGVLLHDLVVVAAGETELDFYGKGWYGVLPLAGFYQAVSSFDPTRIANGLYWTILPAVSAINGILLLRRLRARIDSRILALPLIAVFYAVVSVQYEGALYLYYTLGLSLVSLLWLMPERPAAIGRVAAVVTMAIGAVAITFHAGQSRERTPAQILAGVRATKFAELVSCGLPRCSLLTSAADAKTYGRFVDLIHSETQPQDSILAIPNDAELYFLSARRNATRFYNAAHGTTTEAQRRELFEILERTPPRLVIFRPGDKYNTRATAEFMTAVRGRYMFRDKHDGVETYSR